MRIESEIGKRLEDARKRAGLSLGQVATMIDVSKGAVHQWEDGLNIPEARIVELAGHYGVSEHWIKTGKADPSVAGHLSEIVAMLEKSSMTDEGKTRILAIAESSAVVEQVRG
jgi:transcriptional regulator with XRE-family HTH domain